MNKVFANPTNILTGELAGKRFKLVTVAIGKNTSPFKCLLMDQAGGAQPFRTQYDIALDGTQYVLAAGKGRGNYELKLLEGPINTCSNAPDNIKDMSLHQIYKNQMDRLDGRKITIVTGSNPDNTRESWKFTGIIDQLATYAHVSESGERYIVNVITATGMWE